MSAKVDSFLGLVLLVFCATMFRASYAIRDLGFSGLKPEIWPQFLLVLLTGLSFSYLVRSVMQVRKATSNQNLSADQQATITAVGLFQQLRNPLVCFVLFLLYLLVMPYLGMLISGMLFIFALMGMLGSFTPKAMLIHALLAVFTMGSMWSVFTYGLRVFLPEGSLTGI